MQAHVTMPFGLHPGIALTEESDDYLRVLFNQTDVPPWFTRAVKREMRRREPPRKPARVRRCDFVDGDMASAIIDAGRRALALQYHPDKGGDLKVMRSVNATADMLLAQFPRRRRAR